MQYGLTWFAAGTKLLTVECGVWRLVRMPVSLYDVFVLHMVCVYRLLYARSRVRAQGFQGWAGA